MSSDFPGPINKQLKTLSENQTGVTIFDKTDPRSVYNLVPGAMQDAMDEIDPKFYDYRFASIEKHLRPDVRDYQLRVAFWREYNHTQDNWKRSISLHAVMKGICSAHYMWNDVLRNPLKLAFILFPVTDMQASMEEMMDLGLREMRKILKMPNSGKGGANLPVIREKIKIVALLQNRIKGSVIQRVAVDQRTNVKISSSSEAPKSLAEINREIKKIERTVRNVTTEETPAGESEPTEVSDTILEVSPMAKGEPLDE